VPFDPEPVVFSLPLLVFASMLFILNTAVREDEEALATAGDVCCGD
jgi:hypothetical protein